MKTILLYGDSNTWGLDPATMGRFPADVRWGGVCRALLGDGYTVIEEGLSGRTTVNDDPVEPYRSGIAHFMPILLSHHPLDLIAIMLGTNDCSARYSLTPPDIARGMARLVTTAQKSETGIAGGVPQILIIAPPPFARLDGTRYAESVTGGDVKSAALAAHYERTARELGVHFMDAGIFATSSPIDAIHLESDAHRALGEAAAAKCRSILI